MHGHGEVVMTFVVIARIFVSLIANRLMYELAGLLFLGLLAFFVEYVASSEYTLQVFNSRLDTSSGVCMGAVSVPLVLVARLVQQKRMASMWPISNDTECFESEFWYALVSSVGLLVYIWQRLTYHNLFANKNVHLNMAKYWTTFCVILLSLAISFPVKLTNVTLLVLVSICLFNFIVHAFPCCASLGEAMLLSIGIAVYCSKVAYSLFKVAGMTSLFYPISTTNDTMSAVLQGILVGLSSVPWMYKAFAKGIAWMFHACGVRPTIGGQKLSMATSFYVALAVALVIITGGWLQFIQCLDRFWLFWVVEFVFEDLQRLYLCGYWVCVISMSILPFYMVKSTKFERIMVRKVFHLMVVIMFVPALVMQQAFLKLAFSVALAGFVVIEMIRVLRIPPLGDFVHKFMTAFTDSRDSDLLIISHFSLLLGCALPLWLNVSPQERLLAPFAGVVSLGVGDTMASVAGFNFGSLRLTSNNKKTLEGAIAGAVSMFLAYVTIQAMLFQQSLTTGDWTCLVVAVLCTAFMEAYTTQLDNLFLPLIKFSLLIV